MHMVHEGEHDDESILYKIAYTYDNNGDCTVVVVDYTSLFGAAPCHGSNGIESLAWKETSGGIAKWWNCFTFNIKIIIFSTTRLLIL